MRIFNNYSIVIRNQKAFTLLEVLVAMVILAVTLTTLFKSQSQSLSMAAEAKFNTSASLLAGLKIAELESGYVDLVDAEGEFGQEFPGYAWKVEVHEVSAAQMGWIRQLAKNLRRVDLTIFWGGDHFLYKTRMYIRTRDV
jgi:general secretion pathway protein I